MIRQMTDWDGADYPDTSVLPARQQRILSVIASWVARYGYAPGTRDIGRAVGLAPSTVSKHLKTLEDHGFLRRGTGVARPMDVRLFLREPAQRDSGGDTVPVPVLGDIAAGAPITAEQHDGETLTLSRDLVGGGTVFGLRVRGESMTGAGIHDGDIVVVRQQSEAHSGQIVAAMIDDEATVKVYRRRSGHTYLEPRNDSYPVLDGDHAVVLGRVVSVMRRV